MTASTAPGRTTPRVGRRAYRALLPGFLIANLEGSLVNVALPTLQRDLHVSLSSVGWVPLACLLPTAALCPLMGVVADRAGRRRIYTSGLVLVGLGSLAAALAPGLAVLLAARALQGLGCAALIANGLAIVAEQFEPNERGRALGSMTAIVGIGAILSPPLGGALAEYIGWRGVFLVNLLAVMPGVWWVIDRIPPDRSPVPGWWRRVPWAAAGLLVAAASSAIVGLWGGSRWGWRDPVVIGVVAIALPCGVLFQRVSRGASEPVIDLRDLPARTAWSLVALALGSVALAALGFALPLHLAELEHVQGLELGLRVVPFPLGLVAGAVTGGAVGDRRGTRAPVIGGLALFAAGVALYSRGGLAALALAGFGLGAFSVGNNAELVHGPERSVGSISGLMGLLRLGGQVLGVALAGVVLARFGTIVGVDWIAVAAVPAIAAAVRAYRAPGRVEEAGAGDVREKHGDR